MHPITQLVWSTERDWNISNTNGDIFIRYLRNKNLVRGLKVSSTCVASIGNITKRILRNSSLNIIDRMETSKLKGFGILLLSSYFDHNAKQSKWMPLRMTKCIVIVKILSSNHYSREDKIFRIILGNILLINQNCCCEINHKQILHLIAWCVKMTYSHIWLVNFGKKVYITPSEIISAFNCLYEVKID